MGNEAKDKGPVLSEVLRGEIVDQPSLGQAPPGSDLSPEEQMVPDELDPVWEEHEPEHPNEEADDAGNEDKDHPEPEEEVDLLVVQVNRQDALDRVGLGVGQILTPDGKVAVGDPREGDGAALRPVVRRHHVLEEIEAERIESDTENLVQDEELSENVGYVEHLGNDEDDDEVIAQSEIKRQWFCKITAYYPANN